MPSGRRLGTSGGYEADYYLILAGDHLYRMDYGRCSTRTSTGCRHHGRGAAGDAGRRAGDGHLSLRSRRPDRRVRGEAEPRRLVRDRQQRAPRAGRSAIRPHSPREAVHRVDGHLRVLARSAARAAAEHDGHRLRARDHSGRAEHLPRARLPARRLLGRRRNRGVVLRREHHAHAAACAVQVLRSAAADLHARAVSAAVASCGRARCASRSSPRDAFSSECAIEQSVIGIRTHIGRGTRITRSVLLGADMYASETEAPLGIGRDVVLDRVIIDKNAASATARASSTKPASSTPTATATTSAAASSSSPRAAASPPAPRSRETRVKLHTFNDSITRSPPSPSLL